MKLEFEITEQEIKDALERKVRQAIAEQNTSWNAANEIKDRTKKAWGEAVESLLAEILGDSEELKRMVAAEVEKRIKARVTAVLKAF